MLPHTILRFPIRSMNITWRLDLDRRVSAALILFFTLRRCRPTCTHLLRPLSQSPVGSPQMKNKTLSLLTPLYPRHIRLFLFLEMQSESVPAVVMMRLSVCITALGPAVQKATVPLITSMLISSCSATGVNALRPVRFTAFFVTKTGPSNLRQSGQNSRSLGSNGARLRKMNQNVSRGLSGLRNASVCAQSKACSTPLNPTSGSPGPCLMEDNSFTDQVCPAMRWTNSLLLAKQCRDTRQAQKRRQRVHSHYSHSSMATLSLAQLIRSTPSCLLLRPCHLHGLSSPHNTRAPKLPRLPSRAVLHRAMLIYRRKLLMTMRGSVRDNPGLRHLFRTPQSR